MEYFKDNLDWNPKAETPLRIIIVGAGIAGLTTGIALKRSGHNVTILEQVSQIAEVGAGIQMAPNNTRILGRLGVLPALLEQTNMMTRNSLRRWADNEELGSAPIMPAVGEKFGAPMGVIHRGDLQRILLEAAKKEDVDIRTGSKVEGVDEGFEARVRLVDGEWVEGDVVIAADGVKSQIRRQIVEAHGHVDHASPTGDSAYRILIPEERMKHDEGAMKLLKEDVGMRWMGPGGHIMAYPIKRNTVYNMVLLHPQQPNTAADESWTRRGSKAEMLAFYSSWCPEVRNLLSYVPEGEVMEWTLNSHAPLPSWHENKVVLIGDSCHPMLPYVAQGAAQAIEDAGVLQVCFTKTADVKKAIGVYEQVRKARGEAIQQSASQTRRALHLPDGPEQRQRDRKIKEAASGKGENPDLWSDQSWQEFMWGTDVMGECVGKWDELVDKAEGHHLPHLSAVAYT
ncbi:FAD/NAD(P)-binding domain-containing protein [Saccharata proteae CBS 121410]|uniref:FAD/NAD(P)-binding domain-containing protein n=1 Tax=Saccharata proteae CBS 121410 TaxID=1314787 RepID=A0A9P4LSX6_9PEZI|nr:FAD/NAD(P)-binding domain-containing protein [Saccharata proteae CBS 121410]